MQLKPVVMKKIILFVFTVILFNTHRAFAQTHQDTTHSHSASYSIHEYDTNHEFIFDANVVIFECTEVGVKKSNTPITAMQGYTFNIKAVDPVTGALTIKFVNFTDLAKREIYNNKKYFILTRNDKINSCSDNTDSNWTISYGALVTPFKFRPTKSLFTSNLNLGSSVYFQYKLSKDWSHGVVVGISLSSVSLDSLSTNYKIKTNSDRPALTPSISYVLSCKNISFTLGIGADYINKTSVIEQSWIFNGKPWIGFGIGINLFNSGGSTSKTEQSADQSKSSKSTTP